MGLAARAALLAFAIGAFASFQEPTKEEWEANVGKLVSIHDTDGDGFVTVEEMSATLEKTTKDVSPESLSLMAAQQLKLMDADKDGVVNSNEASAYLGSMIPGGKHYAKAVKEGRRQVKAAAADAEAKGENAADRSINSEL